MSDEGHQRAANTMYQAADNVMNAANSMADTFRTFTYHFERQIIELNNLVERLEKLKQDKSIE